MMLFLSFFPLLCFFKVLLVLTFKSFELISRKLSSMFFFRFFSSFFLFLLNCFIFFFLWRLPDMTVVRMNSERKQLWWSSRITRLPWNLWMIWFLGPSLLINLRYNAIAIHELNHLIWINLWKLLFQFRVTTSYLSIVGYFIGARKRKFWGKRHLTNLIWKWFSWFKCMWTISINLL